MVNTLPKEWKVDKLSLKLIEVEPVEGSGIGQLSPVSKPQINLEIRNVLFTKGESRAKHSTIRALQ